MSIVMRGQVVAKAWRGGHDACGQRAGLLLSLAEDLPLVGPRDVDDVPVLRQECLHGLRHVCGAQPANTGAQAVRARRHGTPVNLSCVGSWYCWQSTGSRVLTGHLLEVGDLLRGSHLVHDVVIRGGLGDAGKTNPRNESQSSRLPNPARTRCSVVTDKSCVSPETTGIGLELPPGF